MDIGLVFALLTAVFFAMFAIFIRRGVAHVGESFSALVVSVFTSTILFLLVVTFSSEWDKVWSLSWKGLVLLGGAGIIQSVVGRFLYLTSVRLIGANKASAIARTSILYAVILGIFILNESLTTPLFLGIVAIIAGVTLVSVEKQGVNEGKQAGQSRIRVKGIITGLGTGLCWGSSGVLIKIGVAEIGSPLAGAFVSFATASLIIASLLLRRELRGRLTQLHRASLIPFIISGVMSTIGHLFRYNALNYSPVSLVVPITSMEIIFILLFSFLLNRNLEVFTWRIIVGMVAAVAGVIFLSS